MAQTAYHCRKNVGAPSTSEIKALRQRPCRLHLALDIRRESRDQSCCFNMLREACIRTASKLSRAWILQESNIFGGAEAAEPIMELFLDAVLVGKVSEKNFTICWQRVASSQHQLVEMQPEPFLCLRWRLGGHQLALQSARAISFAHRCLPIEGCNSLLRSLVNPKDRIHLALAQTDLHHKPILHAHVSDIIEGPALWEGSKEHSSHPRVRSFSSTCGDRWYSCLGDGCWRCAAEPLPPRRLLNFDAQQRLSLH
mmetsp:Transcript_34110/g.90982  ORF Transcript_34110/g.90982 Transcript_34110/m.90982 type:complete len:254 (+) Transcript_34110:1419-2180(+)